MEDRNCESCRNRHDCKAKEALEQLQRLTGSQCSVCSGYEYEEPALHEELEAFKRKVRKQIASTLKIPLDVLKEIEGDAEKATKERFIELLKNADEYSADRAITDYDEAIADNADYLIAHGATVCEWIPVTERMPESGEFVLCYCRANIFDVLKWSAEDNGWRDTDRERCYFKSFVTHWMPLPAPPTTE